VIPQAHSLHTVCVTSVYTVMEVENNNKRGENATTAIEHILSLDLIF
jgi:hypothetical protein